MKKIILALVAALGLAGAAEATTISGAYVFNPVFNVVNPGFQIKAVKLANSGSQVPNFSILTGLDSVTSAVGSTQTVNLFVLRTLQTKFEPGKPGKPDDGKLSPFGLQFNIQGFGGALLSGVTYAVNALGGAYGVFDVTSAHGDIYLGAGKHLFIDVADAIFNKGTATGFYAPGKANGAVISAKFTIGVSSVPLPAALPMGMGALALMGFVGRRRKNKTV